MTNVKYERRNTSRGLQFRALAYDDTGDLTFVGPWRWDEAQAAQDAKRRHRCGATA